MSPYLCLVFCLTALKLLLIPTYKSTDFEVHRNWLAITHSLPISQWYTDATSVWTLDYPPFFAWFEHILSHFAAKVDPAMLVVENLEYASWSTVIFQRSTVIITDSVLVLAAYYHARSCKSKNAGLVAYYLVVANAGLLLVDHIHFQYNGFLLGVLLWSCYLIQQGQDLAGGSLFAALLHTKHLFAYAAPVYFVYILRHYCRGPKALQHFVSVGAAVVAISLVSLWPFIAMDQLQQLLSRLFPFGRGLLHAYWAPNVWALYAVIDKVAAAAMRRAGLDLAINPGNMAGGLVGVAHFAVLSDITPRITAALVVVGLTPCLISLWRQPKAAAFSRAVAYAFLTAFVFGYHVHEKAILMALLPLSFPAALSPGDARHFLLLSAAGLVGLWPLLPEPQEYGVKILLTFAYWMLALHGLEDQHRGACTQQQQQKQQQQQQQQPQTKQSRYFNLLSPYEWVYVGGLLLCEVYCSWIHPYVLMDRLPFVPLLLTSVYCALGIVWTWVRMTWSYIGDGV